jgi:exonuclease III
MIEKNFDVIAIQETHAGSAESLKRGGHIPGYSLIGAIYSDVHGIATYVKSALSNRITQTTSIH